jgi:hypothetical protein
MPLRTARVVRVTTERELDDALASADQVIVEGDDRLLSLAVAKASSDPENDISLQIEGERTASSGSPTSAIVLPSPPRRMSPRPYRRWIFAACFLIILLAASAGIVLVMQLRDLGRTAAGSGPSLFPGTDAAGDQPDIILALVQAKTMRGTLISAAWAGFGRFGRCR